MSFRGSRPLLMQTLACLEEVKAALQEDKHFERSEETNSDDATDKFPLSGLGFVRGDHLAFRTSNSQTFERGRMESAIQGGDEYMTSKQMYQQLDIIQSSVPDNVSGRQWVNTILLRVSAMVASQTEGMVFNSEDITPGLIDPLLLDSDRSVPTTGPIIHTAVLASNIYKRKLFQERRLKRLLVVEAMPGNVVDSVPLAINQMHWAAVSLKQKIIRGALTDGFTWTFIVLRLNEGTRGGMYSCSTPFRIPHEGLYPFRVGPSTVQVEADVVTGILAHWLQHGLEDIDQCDEKEWFMRFGDDGVPVVESDDILESDT